MKGFLACGTDGSSVNDEAADYVHLPFGERGEDSRDLHAAAASEDKVYSVTCSDPDAVRSMVATTPALLLIAAVRQSGASDRRKLAFPPLLEQLASEAGQSREMVDVSILVVKLRLAHHVLQMPHLYLSQLLGGIEMRELDCLFEVPDGSFRVQREHQQLTAGQFAALAARGSTTWAFARRSVHGPGGWLFLRRPDGIIITVALQSKDHSRPEAMQRADSFKHPGRFQHVPGMEQVQICVSDRDSPCAPWPKASSHMTATPSDAILDAPELHPKYYGACVELVRSALRPQQRMPNMRRMLQ